MPQMKRNELVSLVQVSIMTGIAIGHRMGPSQWNDLLVRRSENCRERSAAFREAHPWRDPHVPAGRKLVATAREHFQMLLRKGAC